ncbi:beta-propeller fold lactonase family protein [Streptomyces cavernicola]|uniref:Beta-propeller fold lactonase family protein n=1 Tax=Streptomyces cavernicola TaxID=3043613 RepID=A0ABT6SBT5_9ACTN|nr:beta-propeller fold lactonase family protein [Streptomyces sp. B-S-A6]MDI3405655.1 beta-propeller fold lactonase family protein [Streptomyces sp. B-S-A6]
MGTRKFRRNVVAASAAAAVVAAGGVGVAMADRGGAPAPRSSESAPAAGRSNAPVQAPALPGAQAVSPSDRVYTADQTSNTVTVIDPSKDQVLGTLALGSQRLDGVLGAQYLKEVGVHGLGFSRDGRHLGVVSVTTNSAVVIDTATNEIVSKTYVGRAAHEGFFSADGSEFWAAERGQDTVAVVDVRHGGVKKRIRTGQGPSKVLFSPDGERAYVNHIGTAEVAVVDTEQKKVVQRIRGIGDVFSPDAALSPDGRELWVGQKKAGKVTVVDVRAGRVLTVLDTGPETNHINFVTTADTAYAYVTVGGRDETLVYERRGAHPRLVDRIRNSGSTPHGIWPSPDNSKVYVALERGDGVDVIDTRTRTVTKSLDVGQDPQALVYVARSAPAANAGLGRQGLSAATRDVPVDAPADAPADADVEVTARPVDGLDQLQLSARALEPSTAYTLYARRSGERVPLVDFTTDAKGAAPQVLVFARFTGVYDDRLTVARATGKSAAAGHGDHGAHAHDD